MQAALSSLISLRTHLTTTLAGLHVEPAELEARRSRWQAPAPYATRGVLAKYAHVVSSASEGAVTDKYLD